jgi:hypothetical protein
MHHKILSWTAATFLAGIAVVLTTMVAAASPPTDYVGTPGPIEFDGKSFHLAWSGRPNETYVKQEYVPSGQTVEAYSQMLLVELVTGSIKVVDAVKSQVDMLKKRKGSDPLVNMNILQHDATGEVLLDFIVSTKDAKGEYIVEWDAYRYAPYKDASGKTGVLLYAISHRAYGNESAKAFLSGLKRLRPAQIGALTKAALPLPHR